jgi:transposase
VKGKFTTERRSVILASLAEGLTQVEAAARSEVTSRALKGWIARGRKESDGVYADFAAAVDAVLTAGQRKSEDLTEAEHRALVAERCRNGSDTALKLYWEMIRAHREPEEAETDTPEDFFRQVEQFANAAPS